MEEKYYIAMAIDVDGYVQSDYLNLIMVNGNYLIGYASEFDICTVDIEDACTDERTHRAQWFGWDEEWKWRAATLEEIKALKLEKYLIGSKKDMKLSTPIDPL